MRRLIAGAGARSTPGPANWPRSTLQVRPPGPPLRACSHQPGLRTATRVPQIGTPVSGPDAELQPRLLTLQIAPPRPGTPPQSPFQAQARAPATGLSRCTDNPYIKELPFQLPGPHAELPSHPQIRILTSKHPRLQRASLDLGTPIPGSPSATCTATPSPPPPPPALAS